MSLLIARRGSFSAQGRRVLEQEVVSPPVLGSYSAEVLSDNPVGYWRFEEISGSTVEDSAGNNDGTVIGANLDHDSGFVGLGSGVSFDGTNDQIEIAATPSLRGFNDYTLEFWVRDDLANSDPAGVISQRGGSSSGESNFSVFLHSSELTWDVAGGSNTRRVTSYTVPQGQWVYIVLTREGSTGTLYVDGSQHSSYSVASNAVPSSDYPTTFGWLQDNTSGWLSGAMDEVAIYNYALPASRVQAHWDARNAAGSSSGVIATGGDNVYDLNGYRHHEFTSSEDFVVTQGGEIEYLVVAGGGGGGCGTIQPGGGGGAGGLQYDSISIDTGIFPVVVGAGGAGGSNQGVNADNGSNSSLSTVTAIGGGGGASGIAQNGSDGGSGGGGDGAGASGAGVGGSGISGQGYNGGDGFSGSGTERASGGGGGAGSNGGNSTLGRGGDAGLGVDMSGIFGDAVGDGGWFASGGVGNSGGSTEGDTAPGGGGAAPTNTAGDNGTPSTGGGGGGSATYQYLGGSGGSGIVIVRYPLIVSSADYSSTILQSGPVHFWDFETVDNDVVSDLAGSLDMTLVSSPTVTSVGGLQGIDVNGSGQRATFNFALESLTDFTIECWTTMDSTVGSSEDRVLWGSGGSSSRLYLYSSTSFGSALGEMRLWSSGSPSQVFVGPNIRDGELKHVAVVREGNNYRLYVNGALSGQGSASGSLTTSSSMEYGGGSSDDRYHQGWLGPLAIFEKALTEAEINQHMESAQ